MAACVSRSVGVQQVDGGACLGPWVSAHTLSLTQLVVRRICKVGQSIEGTYRRRRRRKGTGGLGWRWRRGRRVGCASGLRSTFTLITEGPKL